MWEKYHKDLKQRENDYNVRRDREETRYHMRVESLDRVMEEQPVRRQFSSADTERQSYADTNR